MSLLQSWPLPQRSKEKEGEKDKKKEKEKEKEKEEAVKSPRGGSNEKGEDEGAQGRRGKFRRKLSVDIMVQWMVNKTSRTPKSPKKEDIDFPSPPITLTVPPEDFALAFAEKGEDERRGAEGLAPIKRVGRISESSSFSSPSLLSPYTPTFTVTAPEFTRISKSFYRSFPPYEEDDSNRLKKSVSTDDVETIKLIGVGASSKVYLVRSISNLETYTAMKVINKEESAVSPEEEIMSQLDHPLIVPRLGAHEDDTNRYIHMPYVAGGELFTHLRRMGTFPEPTAQFYAAEIVLALEYVHSKNICYRDLKPENILLSEVGHIQLIDFGTAQYVKKQRAKNLHLAVGTLEYLAPEVIKMKKHQKEADWWALGILLYEMLVGRTPFYSPLNSEIPAMVLSGKIDFPPHVSEHARSLIRGLLNRKPRKRLGCRKGGKGGAEEVKSHPFFSGIKWDDLISSNPPIDISLTHPADTRYFNTPPASPSLSSRPPLSSPSSPSIASRPMSEIISKLTRSLPSSSPHSPTLSSHSPTLSAGNSPMQSPTFSPSKSPFQKSFSVAPLSLDPAPSSLPPSSPISLLPDPTDSPSYRRSPPLLSLKVSPQDYNNPSFPRSPPASHNLPLSLSLSSSPAETTDLPSRPSPPHLSLAKITPPEHPHPNNPSFPRSPPAAHNLPLALAHLSSYSPRHSPRSSTSSPRSSISSPRSLSSLSSPRSGPPSPTTGVPIDPLDQFSALSMRDQPLPTITE